MMWRNKQLLKSRERTEALRSKAIDGKTMPRCKSTDRMLACQLVRLRMYCSLRSIGDTAAHLIGTGIDDNSSLEQCLTFLAADR